MEYIMTTNDIVKRYGHGESAVFALNHVSISVVPHKLTILRGRSGSGKTTLLNILSALDQPTSGQVFFDGKELTAQSERRRDAIRRHEMGFIFQSVALIAVMSAYENIEFGLRLTGIEAKERKRRSEEALALVGLAKRMNHRTQELSGGEQQRVAIARAIAHKPRIIFADEPTAELDTHMALTIMRLFQELVANEGLTIVMTSHDPNIIELADNVYNLADGQIV